MNGNRLKVLIADDESDIRTVVGLNLGLAGIDFGEASDGKEALARLRAERWDACLLDLMMPEIDGFDVLQALSDEHRTGDLALIVLSARHAPSAALRALELGAHAHLAKPFSPNAVAQTVEELAAMTVDERETRRLAAIDRASTLHRLGMPSV